MLISDDAPYDRGKAALSASAKRGLSVFMGKGKCINCHSGRCFSNATNTASRPINEAIETMVMGDGRKATYDRASITSRVRRRRKITASAASIPTTSICRTPPVEVAALSQNKRSPDHFDPKPLHWLGSTCRRLRHPEVCFEPGNGSA